MDSPYFDDELRGHNVLVRTFHRVGTDEEYEANLASTTAFFEQHQAAGFVLDCGHGVTITSAQRKRQSQWLRENVAVLEANPFGMALVIRNAAQRFILSSIYLVTKIPGRNKVVATVDDGLRFVVANMVREGARIPLELQEWAE